MNGEADEPGGGEPPARPERAIEYRGTGFYLSLAVILAVAVLLLILSVQNTQTVMLSFLGADVEVPLFAVVIGAGIVAVVLDELVGLAWRARRRRRLQERAELRQLRSEAAAVPPPQRSGDPEPVPSGGSEGEAAEKSPAAE